VYVCVCVCLCVGVLGCLVKGAGCSAEFRVQSAECRVQGAVGMYRVPYIDMHTKRHTKRHAPLLPAHAELETVTRGMRGMCETTGQGSLLSHTDTHRDTHRHTHRHTHTAWGDHRFLRNTVPYLI
jgi:hypothetical protein